MIIGGGMTAASAVDGIREIDSTGSILKRMVQNKLVEHKQYIDKYGEDIPEIRNWKCSSPT
jgi:xylulose-5-phosphate/fructose-6-phosphate phosphoketolase